VQGGSQRRGSRRRGRETHAERRADGGGQTEAERRAYGDACGEEGRRRRRGGHAETALR